VRRHYTEKRLLCQVSVAPGAMQRPGNVIEYGR
jgi:hypothetical protein